MGSDSIARQSPPNPASFNPRSHMGSDMTADNKSAKDTRTDAQKVALKKTLCALRTMYPKAKIHGHRDFAAKACPSFDATTEYKNI